MLTSYFTLRRFFCCRASFEATAFTAPKKNLVFLGSPQMHYLMPLKIRVQTFSNSHPTTFWKGQREEADAISYCSACLGQRIPSRPHTHTTEGWRAYGNILPKKFLEIPPCGTVNIHPSLLPLYRGAAPVQRALQDGVTETGVSLAYTVRALDSGPIIASEKVPVDDIIKAPDLLTMLFKIGSGLLLRELPHILDGIAKLKAQPQDHSKASSAPKLTNDESCLSFDQDAKTIHNKVRAFADWPGTRAKFQVIDMNGNANVVEIKITTTRISDATDVDGGGNEIIYSRSALLVPCAGDSWLEVLELQPPGKKVMSARDFWNGLRGQKLKLPQKALSHI
ncbi:methionyl-tRNA formyltransferase-like isoform X3 [Zingiber officinale]|uniref:methionyl-tRNA formyltransferase-like isoform X3 n=2 Tax=Zingiber officinale TaxID=94328 RepID=UPI001C4C0337|nr:methionyl-tRNA formyltransferase-like isoform X3 [Zingiber officinale]